MVYRGYGGWLDSVLWGVPAVLAGRVVSVVGRLRGLGYEVYVWREPGSEPERSSVRFSDVVPGLSKLPIGGERLYRHQVAALEALESGCNVVLVAKTGSGKTEAWALPAMKHGWKVLAVYPTLALAADQIRRLEEYYTAIGCPDCVIRVDRPTLDRRGYDVLVRRLQRARVVVTNPAFLLADLKRIASSPGRGLLEDFLRTVDLIVLDELDFYGPRGAHLLLAMVELVSKHLASTPPRVAVLSATLGNPDELCRYLERVTGRRTVQVEGRPFKVPNRVVVVVGKGVDALRDYILSHSSLIASRAPWILEVASSMEELVEHLYEVYEALEAIGLRPPRPGIDPVEVLQQILELPEEGVVTLVFTRSIRTAEKLYRSLRERLPPEKRRLVAVHHHLVSKTRREAVEEAARSGRVRMIVTVRTLAQGIDIGTVGRIVHIGLPVDLREYLQREGRKGRRRSLGETETIIIPAGLWDRKLLEAGLEALREWVSLPLEKLYINPGNAYAAIFKALWKLLRGLDLEPEEERLLRRYNLVEEYESLGGRRLGLSEAGRRFWSELGFYEHGPPYGFRKILRRLEGEEASREEVSTRDAIEKYEPGSFDPMTDSLVVELDYRRRRIYEEPIEEAVAARDWLARAATRYEDVKKAWGERPSLLDDFRYGRIVTSVVLSVRAPRDGFGELVEEPLDVEWIVESRRPRLPRSPKAASKVYHEVAVIPLGAPVRGRYRDYTYGYVFEVPATMTARELAVGLATLLVWLRLDERYAVPLGFIGYTITTAGSVTLVHLWEREAGGLLGSMDWLELAERLERSRLPAIAIPLIAAVDPQAGLELMRGSLGLDDARKLAARVARALAGYQAASLGNLVIETPRPSREHGIAAIAVAYEEADTGEERLQLVGVASYDGDRLHVDTVKARVGLLDSAHVAQKILEHLDRLLSSQHTRRVYYYGHEQRTLMTRLLAASYIGLTLLKTAEREGRLEDATKTLQSLVGDTPVLTRLEPTLARLVEEAAKARARNDTDKLEKLVAEIATRMARAVYTLALAAEKGKIRIRRAGGHQNKNRESPAHTRQG